MNKKILIVTAIIIVLLAGYRFANHKGIIGQSIAEEQAAGQCTGDATALFLRATSTDFSNDEDIARAVFDNLMNGYMEMSGCRQVHISAYSLDSLAIATSTDRQIWADISYSVKPSNMRDTGWTQAGPRKGLWVRGIPASLSIYRTADGYFLAI